MDTTVISDSDCIWCAVDWACLNCPHDISSGRILDQIEVLEIGIRDQRRGSEGYLAVKSATDINRPRWIHRNGLSRIAGTTCESYRRGFGPDKVSGGIKLNNEHSAYQVAGYAKRVGAESRFVLEVSRYINVTCRIGRDALGVIKLRASRCSHPLKRRGLPMRS